jgi:pyruvate formate lyase activating enzyme
MSLRIGYLQKFSSLDYPDKLSCIVFTKGCNFRCGFCYNKDFVLPELLDKTEDVSHQEFFNFLDQRKGKLDGVVICGGEPTIYKEELIDFLKKIKEKGFLVKLDSNGSNPNIIKKIIQLNLVDYIAMDLKQTFDKYNLFTNLPSKDVEETFKIIKESNIDHEFRITTHPELSLEDFNNILKLTNSQKVFVQDFINKNTIKEYINPITIFNKLDKNSKEYILR